MRELGNAPLPLHYYIGQDTALYQLCTVPVISTLALVCMKWFGSHPPACGHLQRSDRIESRPASLARHPPSGSAFAPAQSSAPAGRAQRVGVFSGPVAATGRSDLPARRSPIQHRGVAGAGLYGMALQPSFAGAHRLIGRGRGSMWTRLNTRSGMKVTAVDVLYCTRI